MLITSEKPSEDFLITSSMLFSFSAILLVRSVCSIKAGLFNFARSSNFARKKLASVLFKTLIAWLSLTESIIWLSRSSTISFTFSIRSFSNSVVCLVYLTLIILSLTQLSIIKAVAKPAKYLPLFMIISLSCMIFVVDVCLSLRHKFS